MRIDVSAARGSGEGVMTAASPSPGSSNLTTSAPLEQQKQWWPAQQEGVVSESPEAQTVAEVGDGIRRSPLQKPKAATSAVSHRTNSRTPARRPISDDCTTVEGEPQSER